MIKADNLLCVATLIILACGFLPGCGQLQVITPDEPKAETVNCLDFATSYTRENGGDLVVGLYRPVMSVYHAWVSIGGGMCIDQMRIFKCDDSRYKELACKDDIDDGLLAGLMGSRL